jgi:hypothetical protein
MENSSLQPDKDFTVKEWSALSYVVGGICLFVFVVSMLVGDYGWGNFFDALAWLVIPGGIFILNARRKKVYIMINRQGFHYKNGLVTTWDHFIDAQYLQKEVPGSYSDNFYILFRYRNAADGYIYELEIPLSSTQDKAEEEIIAAIQYYYDLSREPV